jgi:hypothetical protein
MQEIEAMQEMAGVAGLGSPIRSRRAVPAHAVLAAAIRSTALLCILITGARGATEAEACAEDLEAIPGFLQVPRMNWRDGAGSTSTTRWRARDGKLRAFKTVRNAGSR